MSEPQQSPQFLDITVPPELEAGAYANLLAIWHTEDEFTFDFAVRQPPREAHGADGTAEVHLPARVVSRVKIPPGQVFEILKALNENMTRYEASYGEIRRPRA